MSKRQRQKEGQRKFNAKQRELQRIRRERVDQLEKWATEQSKRWARGEPTETMPKPSAEFKANNRKARSYLGFDLPLIKTVKTPRSDRKKKKTE